MQIVYLYGAGGHAKVIVDILKEHNICIPEIIDDNDSIKELVNIPIIHDATRSPLIISIGNNKIRQDIVNKLNGVEYYKAIAKSSIISDRVIIDIGTVVMQGAVIQSSSKIGKHAIINTGATIDHDCIIDDYVHIAPGCNLCGNVEVGEGTFIGAGTTIIPGVKIGKWCLIGAGSVIRKNIPDNTMAAGNPCKIYKTINNE